MDRKSIDFARHWSRRYVREHRPYGLDESDVENMILRRLHYNKNLWGHTLAPMMPAYAKASAFADATADKSARRAGR